MHTDAPGDGGALLADAVLLVGVLLVAGLVAGLVTGLGADLGHGVAHAGTPGQALVVIAQGQLFNHEVGQQGRFEGQTAQSVDLGADDISLVASLLIQVDVAVLHAAEQFGYAGGGGAFLFGGERIRLDPGVGAACQGGYGYGDNVREVEAALGANRGDAHFSLFADDAVTHKDDALFGARYEGAAVRGSLTGDGEGLPDAVSVYVVGGGRRGSSVGHSIVS